MRTLCSLIVAMLLVSCWANPNWRKFPVDGIPEKDENYKDMVFVSNRTGYLGGSHLQTSGWSGDKINFTITPVLYKTNDKGRSWGSIPVPYKGAVNKIIAGGDTLTLVVQDGSADSNCLVQSLNEGKTWKELLRYPKHTRIGDVLFESTQRGRLVIGDHTNQYLLAFNKGRWDTLSVLSPDLSHYILQDRLVSLIPVPNTANSRGYTITDLRSLEKSEVLFDHPCFIASSTKYQEELYFAASYNNKRRILKLTRQGCAIIELGSYADFQPSRIAVFANKMIAIANQQRDVGPIGVTHSCLVSSDAGKTWSLEELPDPLYVEPIAMYKDQFFMAYCGTGFFQKRE